MTNWIKTNLHSAANLVRSNVLSFVGSTKYIATADVENFKLNPSEEVTFSNRPSRADIQLDIGDVLQAKMKDTNKSVLVNQDMAGWLASTGFARFKPISTGNSSSYIYHFLSSPLFLRQRDRLSVGSTQQAISDKDLKSISICIPKDIELQNDISNILNLTNTAIERTEALIEKYQQIKAGLMQDLFTRGIGADGKLRPHREQAAELYQQTPIGWIPNEWELKPCSELCSRICVGIVIQPTQYYVEDGVPAFRSANVREDGVDPTNLVYVSAVSNNLLVKSQIKHDDILTVRTGYPGTSAVVPLKFNGANCIDILISTPNGKVTSDYLCNWINSSFGKGQVLRQQGGMAQQHFNVGEMRELLVALPKTYEQNLISERLKAISNKLKAEQDTALKLSNQKLGLMHDLLSGKVQVPTITVETAHV